MELQLEQGEVHVYLAHENKLEWPCADQHQSSTLGEGSCGLLHDASRFTDAILCSRVTIDVAEPLSLGASHRARGWLIEQKKGPGIAVRNDCPQRRYSGQLPRFERRLTESVGSKGRLQVSVNGCLCQPSFPPRWALSTLHIGELCGHFSISHGQNVNAAQVPRLAVAHLVISPEYCGPISADDHFLGFEPRI